jgi:hypothetical protein
MSKYLILLVLCSCSSWNKLSSHVANKEVIQISQRFINEAKARKKELNLSKIKIRFADLKIAGVCDRKNQTITFDYKQWFRLDILRKEYLVFHELSHCSLNKDHDIDNCKNVESYLCKNFPDSFDTYLDNRSKLLDKLLDYKKIN